MIADLLMTTDLSALSPWTHAVAWAHPLSGAGVQASLGADVCPTLPSQVVGFKDMFLGWAKGLFIAVLPISAIAALVVVLVGKLVNSPRAGQAGAVGLLVVLATAVGYGIVFGILQAIVGAGC